MINNKYCFSHNPAAKKAKKRAILKGGLATKKRTKSVAAIKITTVKNVAHLIIRTINELRENKIDTKVANCIFYGSGQLIKALEISDLERRLEQLESITKRGNYTNE